MANIRVKDLPNTNSAADTDEFIIDSSTAGTRRLSYSELKSEISTDFQGDVNTYKIATLASDNKLDPSQIPDTLSQGLNFVGVANSASDLTSTTQGDFYVIQTAFGVYSVGDQAVYDGSAYIRVTDGTKEISEGGTGATTLDAAKTNLEIGDIGTQPNELVIHGHLSSMAYQSADSVSVAKLEVADKVDGSLGIGVTPDKPLHVGGSGEQTLRLENTDTALGDGDVVGSIEFEANDASGNGSGVVSKIQSESLNALGNLFGLSFHTGHGGSMTEKMVLDNDGRVGIGTASPGYPLQVEGAYFNANFPFNVAVQNNTTAYNVTDNGSGIVFGGRTAASGGLITALAGVAGCKANNTDGNHDGNLRVLVRENGASSMTESARFTKAGLVMGSGMAIDFGSTNTNTGVTVTGSVMSEFEQGTFTPKLADAATGGNEASIGTVGADYIRVGNQVFFAMRLIDINTTGLTSGNTIYITDMPYVCKSGSSFVPFNVMADTLTFGGQLVGVIQGGVGYANLRQFSNGSGDSAVPVSAISSGATDLFISGSYFVA